MAQGVTDLKTYCTRLAVFFCLLFSSAITASGAVGLTLEVSLGAQTVYVVGVSHATLDPLDARLREIDTMLRASGIGAVAVETFPDRSKLLGSWTEVFDGAAQANSFLALSAPNRDCVERAVSKNSLFTGLRKRSLEDTHVGGLLILLEQSKSIQPSTLGYVGTEFLVLALSKKQGLVVAEIEGFESAFRAYVNLPHDEIIGAINAFCKILNDKKLSEEFTAFNTLQLARVRDDVPIEGLRTAQLSFFEHIGLSDYPIRMSDNRNPQLAENILQFARQHKCSLVMVGELHLSGSQSLQKLLVSSGAIVRLSKRRIADIDCEG